MRAAIASPTWVVLAVPPRSGVRGPLLMVSSMALTMASCAARPAPWPGSEVQHQRADQIMAIGLAMFCRRCRARSRARARTGWECALGVQVGRGARPMVPVVAGPRSPRMSPNRLVAATTSKRPGCTKRAVRMSMCCLSSVISG